MNKTNKMSNEAKVLLAALIVFASVIAFVMCGHSQGQLDYQICEKDGGQITYLDDNSMCLKDGKILWIK